MLYNPSASKGKETRLEDIPTSLKLVMYEDLTMSAIISRSEMAKIKWTQKTLKRGSIKSINTSKK